MLTRVLPIAETGVRRKLFGDGPQSFKYMCGFRPLPFSTNLISPSLRKFQRGWLIPRSVREMGLVFLMNSTSILAVKKPRLCCSVCRTSSIAPSFPSRFTVPSRGFAHTATAEARPGLARGLIRSAVAAALSKRSTALIRLRHLARHARSSASRRLSNCALRALSAFWSIFSMTVPDNAGTWMLGDSLLRCQETPYKVLRVVQGIPREHVSGGHCQGFP